VTQLVLSLVLACLIPFWFFIANVIVVLRAPARNIGKALSPYSTAGFRTSATTR
jgi:hypothetical protein